MKSDDGMKSDDATKAVIVTGAAQGIGQAITLRLLEEGCAVLAADKNSEGLEALKGLVGNDPRLTTFVLDVTDFAAVSKFFDALRAKKQFPYGLVNNAGIFFGTKFLEYTQAEIDQLIQVNLFGPIYMTQLFGKLLIPEDRPGAIVNIASIAGQIGSSDAIYGVSKAGVIGLTKTAAMSFAPRIRVNAVAPGIVDTDMMKVVSKERIEQFRRGELLRTPIHAEDIADSVWFLLSDQSTCYTGAVLDINNGFNLR
jgi:3-oxoacyl-[acyl-carrier protein] reductase